MNYIIPAEVVPSGSLLFWAFTCLLVFVLLVGFLLWKLISRKNVLGALGVVLAMVVLAVVWRSLGDRNRTLRDFESHIGGLYKAGNSYLLVYGYHAWESDNDSLGCSAGTWKYDLREEVLTFVCDNGKGSLNEENVRFGEGYIILNNIEFTRQGMAEKAR